MMSGTAGLPPRLEFPEHVSRKIQADNRRLLVIGAGGWIGRSLLAMLWQCLGPDAFQARVVAFGSSARAVRLSPELEILQRPLHELANLKHAPSMAFHLAFLTKDKVAGMNQDAYVRANRALSDLVLAGLDTAGADRLFLASSGAAAFADDENAAPDLRLYGRLKRDDEARFASWAGETRRLMTCRIYAVSGPYVNKPETYALASFIVSAMAGGPVVVNAPRRVVRSYVAVREVLSAAVAVLLDPNEATVTCVDSGGDPTELMDVATLVADLFGTSVVRAPITAQDANFYVGDDHAWRKLLHRHALGSMTLPEQILETAQWLQTR